MEPRTQPNVIDAVVECEGGLCASGQQGQIALDPVTLELVRQDVEIKAPPPSSILETDEFGLMRLVEDAGNGKVAVDLLTFFRTHPFRGSTLLHLDVEDGVVVGIEEQHRP